MSQVKHIIEHRVATPRQYHLPPLQNYPQPPPPAPAPQHIIQQVPVPQPVYQNFVPEQQQQKSSMFNKAGKCDSVQELNRCFGGLSFTYKYFLLRCCPHICYSQKRHNPPKKPNKNKTKTKTKTKTKQNNGAQK